MRDLHKKILGTIIVGLGLLLAIPAGATDYQSYSLEELNDMRGNMATASTEERNAFRNTRQQKIQALSPDERLSYQKDDRKGSGSGNRNSIRARNKSGSGSMKRGGGSSDRGSMRSGGGQHRGGKR